jgi:cytoskeletal protein RodZ
LRDVDGTEKAADLVSSELALAFGQELQTERERQKVSLASIAEATKVPQRHLIALETNQFEELPGGIFAKGIVRSYCRQLGLAEEQWLARFPGHKAEDETHSLEPAWSEFAENVSRARIATEPRMGMRWWGVLLMAAVLCGLSWVAWQYVVQPQVLGATAAHTSAK